MAKNGHFLKLTHQTIIRRRERFARNRIHFDQFSSFLHDIPVKR